MAEEKKLSAADIMSGRLPTRQKRAYEAKLWFGSVYIQLKDGDNTVGNGKLSSSEVAAIGVITEVLRRLRRNQRIELEIPKEAYGPAVEEGKMVLCEWLSSGRLKVHSHEPRRRWEHASTTKEAMMRAKAFTCSADLAKLLPARRDT